MRREQERSDRWSPPGGWDHEKHKVNPMFLNDGSSPSPGMWDEAEMQILDVGNRNENDEDDEFEGERASRPERRATTSINHASIARWTQSGTNASEKIPLLFRRDNRTEITLMWGHAAEQWIKGQATSKESNECRVGDERQGRMRREIGDAIERAASQTAQTEAITELEVIVEESEDTPALERKCQVRRQRTNTGTVPSLTWKDGPEAMHCASLEEAFKCLTRLLLDFRERRGWIDRGRPAEAKWVLHPLREAWCVLKIGDREERRENDQGTFNQMMTPRERRNNKIHRVVLGEVNRYGQHYKRQDGTQVDLGKGMRVGEIIHEERLVPMGITTTVLARAINIPRAALAAVMDGHEPMSAAMSARLGKTLGDPEDYWYNADKGCKFENFGQIRRQIGSEVREVRNVLSKVEGHPEYQVPRPTAQSGARHERRLQILGENTLEKKTVKERGNGEKPTWDETSDTQPPHLALKEQ